MNFGVGGMSLSLSSFLIPSWIVELYCFVRLIYRYGLGSVIGFVGIQGHSSLGLVMILDAGKDCADVDRHAGMAHVADIYI